MSIGSLLPNTDVTVLISVSYQFLFYFIFHNRLTSLVQYVVDLSEDDQVDSVRFQLSSHVRARYGAPSNSALYHDKIHRALLTITVDIEMPGAILGVTSINHNPFLELPVPSNSSALGPRHHIRKQFVSPDLIDLQKDFLLIVYALGLGKPRCLAEHLSHEENSPRGITGPTTALACTIVPQFGKARSSMQEYLFLIDRSGSMTGLGIAMAKETLELLLKQLPSTNAMFNVFGFGSVCESQWPLSKLSTEAAVREAVRTNCPQSRTPSA
jgi:von Willebrand factor type A domain